jgi:putative two-component system response regulator
MAATYYCPHCGSNQPSYEYWEQGELKARCLTCGYPISEAAIGGTSAPGARSKVLCIDDDRLLLGLFVNLLEDSEFEALVAADGPSGIALAQRERPAIILLDVMMPGIDGFEVCRQMRADPVLRETPIIILTAMVDPKLNVKGFQAGATLAMQKPFEPQKLLSTIKTALALKATRPSK